MTFADYEITDNAVGNLSVGITAGSTTIELDTGDGDLLPSSNFIITLTQYSTPADPTTSVVKREKVLITNRSGDTLSVGSRGFDGDSATAFNSGDWVYINITKAVIQDMKDEISRLETDKADDSDVIKTSGDQAGISGNKDGSFNITTSGTIDATHEGDGSALTGVSVDINGQTNDDTLGANDKLIFYKDTVGNRKRTAKASTSNAGLQEISTQTEMEARTDTERSITPALLNQASKTKSGVVSFSTTTDGTTDQTITTNFKPRVVVFHYYYILGHDNATDTAAAQSHVGSYVYDLENSQGYFMVQGVSNSESRSNNDVITGNPSEGFSGNQTSARSIAVSIVNKTATSFDIRFTVAGQVGSGNTASFKSVYTVLA